MVLQWESAEEQLWNELHERNIPEIDFIEYTDEGNAIAFYKDGVEMAHKAVVYERHFRSWEYIGNFNLTFDLEDFYEYRDEKEYPFYMSSISPPDSGQLVIVTVVDPAIDHVVIEQEGENLGELELLPDEDDIEGDGKARFGYLEKEENLFENGGEWGLAAYDRDGQLIQRETY
jgi:hypothetical protein